VRLDVSKRPVATMSERPNHDRTIRLLTARLETIAAATERSPRRVCDLEPHVRRAAAATRNAVRLELLTPEEAGEIWAAVASRHPHALWAKDGPSVAA
jgi:hypothetical protein